MAIYRKKPNKKIAIILMLATISILMIATTQRVIPIQSEQIKGKALTTSELEQKTQSGNNQSTTNEQTVENLEENKIIQTQNVERTKKIKTKKVNKEWRLMEIKAKNFATKLYVDKSKKPNLDVTKTRTSIEDKDKAENPQFVDQEGDVINYSIVITNKSKAKTSENIKLTDDHDVVVTEVKIAGKTIDINNRNNNIKAGDDLLEGLTTKGLKTNETIEIQVKYTVTKEDLATALAGDKKIINTAIATLEDEEYIGKDNANGENKDKEGTDVKNRYSYTVNYYENGELAETTSEEAAEGADIKYSETREGFEFIKTEGDKVVTSTGENILNVYFGKPEITVQKTGTKTINAGNEIEYTITVKNSGYISANRVIEDELKGTKYIENSATIDNQKAEPEISQKDTNQLLSWNIEIGAGSENQVAQKTIKYRVKSENNAFGEKIENTAEVKISKDSKEIEDSSTTATNVNEINVEYNEYKEGQKGEDLNIIFIVDNSSSMNQTAGTAYVNKEQWCPIAPSDREKTKIANAKKAIANFIDKQNGKNTDMRVITFNTSSTEEKSDLKTLKEKVDESQVRDFMDGKYANINNEWVSVVKASDGNYYTYEYKTIKTGAVSVGTNETSNASLKAAVNDISISDEQGGLGTNIVPAYNLILNNQSTYLSQTKKNIIIVLADGEFNDSYNGNKLTTLKSKAQEIYSIGFGTAYNESSLKKVSTNNTCYKATNSSTLLDKFNEILSTATGNKQNKTTVKGRVQFDEATNEIKVSEDCPIKVTYKTGNTENTLFECKSESDFEKYGLTLSANKKVITWDAKKYVANQNKPVPTTEIKIVYYIKSNV